nr:MAG TPA: hypothetical protein [Caudoviricetes sp.]
MAHGFGRRFAYRHLGLVSQDEALPEILLMRWDRLLNLDRH